MYVLQIAVVFRNYMYVDCNYMYVDCNYMYVDCKYSNKTVVFIDCVDLFVNSSTL